MNSMTSEEMLGGKPGDGPISRFINRPLSSRISRFLLWVFPGVTPNMLTFVSTIIGVVSGVLAGMQFFVLGAILIQLSSVVDGCDGEIARAKNLQSAHGDALDSILDRLVDAVIIWGITIGVARSQESQEMVILIASLGWILTLFSFLISYSSAIARKNWTRDFPRTLAGRDVRMLVLAIAALSLKFSALLGIIFLSGLAIFLIGSLILRLIQIWTKSFP